MRGEARLRAAVKDLRHLAAPAGRAQTLLVLGSQRSGTNALLSCFEADPDAKVFPEQSVLNVRTGALSLRDSVRFEFRLRPLPEVASLLARLRYPLAVAKPLVESQNAVELLEQLPRCKVVWLFRNYLDVAESRVRHFGADIHRTNLEPLVAGDEDNWRSERTSEEVRAVVREHYRPEMAPVDGGALFWWVRNRLFFDQSLDLRPDVMVLSYERFIASPAATIAELYRFAGVPEPARSTTDGITPRYVGRGSDAALSVPVQRLCEDLLDRLTALEQERQR